MGVSRRSFLKMLGMATAGIALNPLIPVVANNEIYVNKKLGIAFRIPKEWYFYNVQKMDEMYDSQILKPDAPHIDEYIEELRSQPLVSIGMYPPDEEGNKRFSPSIVLRLEPKDESIEFESILNDSNLYLESVTRNFRALESRQISDICGYRALRGKYGYLYEATGMASTPIIGRSCIIDVGAHFYSFNMYNNDPESLGIDTMFDQLESSIMVL